jgi:Flp pilus assembly protein TadG
MPPLYPGLAETARGEGDLTSEKMCDNQAMLGLRPRRLSRRPRRDRQSGGAAVEFAIVLPLFCTLIFGMIDYGWYFYQRFSVVAAVRDGVRVGVTYVNANAYTQAKAQALADLGASNVPTSSLTWGPTTPISGSVPNQTLTLSVSLPYKALVGFVPTPGTLTAQMTMLLELQ